MIPDFLDATMRRTDLAWTDWPAIKAFLHDELICRIAVHDTPYPYIVPQSFTFDGKAFLIHCSRFGTLAQKLRESAHVTIEVDRATALLKAPKGQNTSLEYYSVIARCTAHLDEDIGAVIDHQNVALRQFRPEGGFAPIEATAASRIVAIRCQVVEMTAKKRILADGQYAPPGMPEPSYRRFSFASGACKSGLSAEAFSPAGGERSTEDAVG